MDQYIGITDFMNPGQAAGGLGPHTTELARPLVEKFPTISLDAQGQLRSSGDALDPIEWDRASTYLTQAVGLFT